MPDWQRGEPVHLETRNYFLRSLAPDDVNDDYIGWWNDPEIQRGLNHRPRGWGREQAIRHVSHFDNVDRFHLGIFPKAYGKLIGFYAIFSDPRHKVGTTNYCIGARAYWGRDVIVETKPVIYDFMFETLGMEKAEGKTIGRNLPSIYVDKVLGVKSEGILRKQEIGPDGRRVDVYLFGVTRDEWLARRQS